MENVVLHIKNMVCDRCISTVREILMRNEVLFTTIGMGTIELPKPISALDEAMLQKEFKKVGFEIISEKNERIVKQIKTIILKEIYEERLGANQNLSTILSEELHFDYSHLSAIFSKLEGRSIQSYQNDLKIERIKELLEYDELSISEIADKLGFSNAAYLSTQFKKSMNISPSQYRLQHKKERNSLDLI